MANGGFRCRHRSIGVVLVGVLMGFAIDASAGSPIFEDGFEPGAPTSWSSSGACRAWESNHFGQLGDGTTATRRTPVQVVGLYGVVGVAAGEWHSLAVRRNGNAKVWGRNSSGQLGDGTHSDR